MLIAFQSSVLLLRTNIDRVTAYLRHAVTELRIPLRPQIPNNNT